MRIVYCPKGHRAFIPCPEAVSDLVPEDFTCPDCAALVLQIRPVKVKRTGES